MLLLLPRPFSQMKRFWCVCVLLTWMTLQVLPVTCLMQDHDWITMYFACWKAHCAPAMKMASEAAAQIKRGTKLNFARLERLPCKKTIMPASLIDCAFEKDNLHSSGMFQSCNGSPPANLNEVCTALLLAQVIWMTLINVAAPNKNKCKCQWSTSDSVNFSSFVAPGGEHLEMFIHQCGACLEQVEEMTTNTCNVRNLCCVTLCSSCLVWVPSADIQTYRHTASYSIIQQHHAAFFGQLTQLCRQHL